MTHKNILCLYDDTKTIDRFNKYKPLLYKVLPKEIYYVYHGQIYNPPFFNLIIITLDILYDENLQMLWNMVLSKGYLIIKTKHINRLLKYVKNITYKKYDDEYTICNKTSAITTIIRNKYRVIDFMIIGVQKAGTTAAMTNLEKHPDIFLYQDELHFYDRDWDKGIEWYKSLFDYKKKLVGEKNPNIIYLEQTHSMIQKINPAIKMILLLRNPIDRAYSAWSMFTKKFTFHDENKKSFEDACNYELKYKIDEPTNLKISNGHILQRGLYYKQIQKLLRYFPRENILILISEQVIENMNESYNKIYNFLGIEDYNTEYKKDLVGEYTNENKKKDISNKLYKKLIKFYRKDIHKLEKFLDLKTNWI
jgi:hypothetical protein